MSAVAKLSLTNLENSLPVTKREVSAMQHTAQ